MALSPEIVVHTKLCCEVSITFTYPKRHASGVFLFFNDKRLVAVKTPCTTVASASAEKWLGPIGFAIGIFRG